MKKHIYVCQSLRFFKFLSVVKWSLVVVSMLVIYNCNSPQTETPKTLNEITKEIMIAAKNCALITVDSLGVAHVRAMDPFLPEENFTVWMGTNSKSLKVKQIQQNSKVSLFYLDKKTGSYVTLQGKAQLVNTLKIKEQFWKKEWENFYKNRVTDYILIEFVPTKANVISEKYNILGDTITWETPGLNF